MKEDFQEQFAEERARLLDALGAITDGGAIEMLQHIGATSVPGLPARSCVDIGLAVCPFPLEPHLQGALEALGYTLFRSDAEVPEYRYRHTTGAFQLFVVEAGSERWTDFILVRDYLRHDAEARQRQNVLRRRWIEGAGIPEAHIEEEKSRLWAALLAEARSWWVTHHGFGPIESVVQELEALACPWYISSGWALDLFLGCVTRVHHDSDVAVARRDQLILQEHLRARGWKLVTPYEGRLEPLPTALRLELPRHQIHAHRDGTMLDFLISEINDGVWRWRRNPVIIRAMERCVIQTEAGIRFLAPEVVLFFKRRDVSSGGRSKDAEDFEKVLPQLEPERRAWLRWALTVVEPQHPWISRLT
jgi:GrpB-like predicted nucleotidyltransferase (UPF0157 family)